MAISNRDIEEVVKRAGAKVVDVQHARHIHVRINYKGTELPITFPRSPSDPNWKVIKYHDIRRTLKSRGLWRD